MLAGCNSSDSKYPALLEKQGTITANAMKAFQAKAYQTGFWNKAGYGLPGNVPQPEGYWEKDQSPAIAEAIFSRVPSNSEAASEAEVATATVNVAIFAHQVHETTEEAEGKAPHPNPYVGDFGREVGESEPANNGVGSTFWAEAEGLVANVLFEGHEVSEGTLKIWEKSMVAYTNWLERSHEATWYTNGNVNLRMALIFLETYKLAQDVGDPVCGL